MRQFRDAPDDKYLVQVDPDLEDLVPVFLEEIQEDLAGMRQALEGRNWETVKALGHKSKGTAGGYGFDGVSELCSSVELAAKEEDHPETEKLLEELQTYLERVEVVFE